MLKPYIYVDTTERWYDCLDELYSVPQFAIDLESNGLHAYRESICLIQISTRTQDYIIDPQADLEWGPLGQLIEDAAVEKVLHASEYDLILMNKAHGWNLYNLFDTMWAVRILGIEKIGLANVLEMYYDLEISKKHQRANWSERPLSSSQLAYAQTDTHYLLQLRDDLTVELEAAGRLEEAAETFTEQARVRIPNTDFDPENFWSINGVKDLSSRGQAILRELNIFRDHEARRKDKPPFKIMGNRSLLALADYQPRHINQLTGIPGMSDRQARRYSGGILNAIARGSRADIPKRPPRVRPPEQITKRYELLQKWRKERAIQRGVASDVVVPKDILWDIAKENPQTWQALEQISSLGPWRRGNYGEEILDVLR